MKPSFAMLRRFRPRFGLRLLFVFIALVALFCGYHMNWIRQRHRFLAENDANLSSHAKDIMDLQVRSSVSSHGHSGPPSRIPINRNRGVPKSNLNLLWLFGEKPVPRITLYFQVTKRADVPHQRIIDTLLGNDSCPVVEEFYDTTIIPVEKLFPESDIVVLVDDH
jgi:hypothetical protein